MMPEGNVPRLAELTVIVPSAYRPEALARCLAGLERQTPAPGSVIAVLRSDDVEGTAECAAHPGVHVVSVQVRGLVAARQAGLMSAQTEWVSFMDDDAEPAPGWSAALAPYVADPEVGCVGGPILNIVGARTTAKWFEGHAIARLDVFGRTVSHLHDLHDGHISADVDFLPGSNLTIRRELARSADHGRAPGMAPNEELEWCLTVKDAGLRVVYDSGIRVAHYPAARIGTEARGDKSAYAYAYAYMLTYTLLRHLRLTRRVLFVLYFWLLGQRAAPGILAAPIYALRPGGWAKAVSGMRGRAAGARDAMWRSRTRAVTGDGE